MPRSSKTVAKVVSATWNEGFLVLFEVLLELGRIRVASECGQYDVTSE